MRCILYSPPSQSYKRPGRLGMSEIKTSNILITKSTVLLAKGKHWHDKLTYRHWPVSCKGLSFRHSLQKPWDNRSSENSTTQIKLDKSIKNGALDDKLNSKREVSSDAALHSTLRGAASLDVRRAAPDALLFSGVEIARQLARNVLLFNFCKTQELFFNYINKPDRSTP